TAAPTATPGPEPDWRTAPILPESLSPRLLAIYRDGQAQGRNPRHFSVIGDCQAIPFVFLGPYERGELTPSSSESYLWDALQYFQGSFNRSGMAVRGGFTAASILNPLHADPYYCIPGETPLTCEYRLYNPAFVFINLETWLDPATVDRYEAYLREILDYVISRGSIPILMTKADASELGTGEHVINPAIVRVAREYDVPLVNFWRAAQYLPNYGIDPTREGFHLSPEGYALKNTLALRALYQVWQAVEAGGAASSGAPSGTPAPSPQATPVSPAAPQVSRPDCAGGCVFFGSAISHDGSVTPNGVFAYDPVSGHLTSVLGPGFDLQDVSADGQRLLVNDQTRLFEVSLADGSSRLLSESLFSLGGQAAYWNADESRVLLLDQTAPLQAETGQAIGLFPTGRDDLLVFESGECTARAVCQSGGLYRLGPDQAAAPLESYLRPVFSPDGRLVAFLNPAAATPENYYHIGYLLLEEVDRGLASRRTFYFSPVRGFMVFPDVRGYAFSPDSRWLFVLYDFYSAYYEKSLRLQTYLLDIQNGILYDYGRLDGSAGSLNPRLVWAPSGERVLFFLTTPLPDGGYTLNVYQTNLQTGERLVPLQTDLLSSNDYFYITNIYWP
ncbi:MAG: SGNH/GDSL hydrolase family protein, partial [Anaerolineales bacterium]